MPKKKILGTPTPLDQGTLPSKLDICNHALHIRNVMENSGVWKQNTKLNEVANKVSEDIKAQWVKTDIPNIFDTEPEKVVRKVVEVLKKGKLLTKTPVSRRKEDFASELNCLFDLSLCLHESPEICNCPALQQVTLRRIL